MRIGLSFNLIKDYPVFFKELSKIKKNSKFFIFFGKQDRLEVIKFLVKNGIDYEPIPENCLISEVNSFFEIKKLEIFLMSVRDSFSGNNLFFSVFDVKEKKSRSKIKKNIDSLLTLKEISDIIEFHKIPTGGEDEDC